MKKTIVIMMVLILSAFFAYAILEIENETHKFVVTLINQEPDPVAPGNLVDVRFRIENRRMVTAKNVEVKLELKYPFSFYWSQDRIKNIGTVAAGQADETGVRVKFRLRVDKNAAEGNNLVEFWYRENGGPWRKAEDYDVEVRERDAVLAINEITTKPEKIFPGSQSNVKFKIENLANSVLKDIKLNLELRKSVTLTTSVSTTELPFTPVGSGNEKTVKKIDPAKAQEVSFDLFVDADAESKMYKIPYTLTYSDEFGTNFTRVGIVGLMVDAAPDISITLDDNNIYSAGAKGTVGIKFVNKGFSDIKFLNVVLKETGDFDILTNKEVYIGNIDSDDYETADYDLLVSDDAQGDVTLPLKVEYRDANGKLYSKDINLKLELFSGKALKQRSDGGGNSFVGILIVLIIVGGGIWFWRWRKKKHSK